jgi:hypothetical protein
MGISTTHLCALVIALACLCPAEAGGQRGELLRPTEFQALLRPAGYVFAGRVSAIEYLHPKANNEVATVRITFRVEQGVRGTNSGSTLTIREWAGLWNAGERYRIGERLFLFLYPPSRLGLTSIVGRGMGRFAVGPTGTVILPPLLPGQLKPAPAAGTVARRIPLREFTRSIRAIQQER